MSLAAGTRLGTYEIVAALGARRAPRRQAFHRGDARLAIARHGFADTDPGRAQLFRRAEGASAGEIGLRRQYTPKAGEVANPSATSARFPRPASGRDKPVTRASSPGIVMPAPVRNARAISRSATSRFTRCRSASGKRATPSVQI